MAIFRLPLFASLLLILVCACSSPSIQPAITPTPTPSSYSIQSTPLVFSTSTPEEWAYIGDIERLTKDMGVAVKRITALAEEGKNTPARIKEDSWRIALNDALKQLRDASSSIRKLKAPPVFSVVQANLNLACVSFDEMAQSIARGINRNDQAIMALVATHYDNALQSIAKARAELDRLIPKKAPNLQI